MSDLIKTSLSLENCSFHPRGERSQARLGLKNDLALKARIFPTRFGARRRGPAVRWVPPGYGLPAEEPRVGFLGIHHFHPLPSRHFIIWDHSVKQYDAAHFYLSRITKPPFSPGRSNKSLQVACGPLSATASPARQGGQEGTREAGGGRAPSLPLPLPPPPPEGTRPAGPARPGAGSSGVARAGPASPRPAPILGLPLGAVRKRLSLTAGDSPTQATSIS